MKIDDETIKELSEIEILDKCTWVNVLESALEGTEGNYVAKELVENIIKEYRKISAIAMSRALMATKEKSLILEDYKELLGVYKKLKEDTLLEKLFDAEPTTLC